jgi:hypothetical protein
VEPKIATDLAPPFLKVDKVDKKIEILLCPSLDYTNTTTVTNHGIH